MPQVILGNSNKRFSGVTSTMLATLPGVSAHCEVAILGGHYVPSGYRILRFAEFLKLCRQPLPDGSPRVFHARRNDEMIQALIAKKLFGAQLRILFTSTAQRHHSKFTKWLMAQMDGILTTCQAAASYLETPPLAVIPHGVDLEEFQPAPDRPALWQSMGHGGEYGIGIFGRVRPSKGTDLLVRAAIPLFLADPRPTLVIIGETTPKFQSFQAELEAEIQAAGLSDRILFLGKLPFAEVKTYFQAVTLVTALSRNEGFGLTVLEAMASGAAVLASDAGAWAEISAGHFPIIPQGDPARLTSELATLLANPTEMEEAGARNRLRAEAQYDITQEAKALAEEYRKAAQI